MLAPYFLIALNFKAKKINDLKFNKKVNRPERPICCLMANYTGMHCLTANYTD